MESPCIKICVIDPAHGLCVGCGRTGEEIGAWTSMPSAVRLGLMADLPARMAAAGVSVPVIPPTRRRRA